MGTPSTPIEEEHIVEARKMIQTDFIGKQANEIGLGDNRTRVLSQVEGDMFGRINDLIALERPQTVKAGMFMQLFKDYQLKDRVERDAFVIGSKMSIKQFTTNSKEYYMAVGYNDAKDHAEKRAIQYDEGKVKL